MDPFKTGADVSLPSPDADVEPYDPDDERLPETPDDVIGALGFDPLGDDSDLEEGEELDGNERSERDLESGDTDSGDDRARATE